MNSHSSARPNGSFTNTGLLISQPISSLAMCIIATTFFIFLLILSNFLDYSGRRKVSGYVRPVEGMVRISVSSDGVVEKLFVRSGERVKEGDRLAVISKKTVTDKIGETPEKSILKLIQYEAQEVEKGYERLKLTENLDVKNIESDLNHLKLSLSLIQNKMKIKTEIIDSKRDILERINNSTSFYAVSKLELAQLNQELFAEQERIVDLANEKNKIEYQISEARIKLEKVRLKSDDDKSKIKSNLINMDRQQVKIRNDESHYIVAPNSGYISTILVDVGDIVNNTNQIFTLTPTGAEQEVELLIPTSVSGLIQLDQKVLLRYQAYPHQIFGLQKGYISYIDEIVIMPNEINLPITYSQPFYRARVTLESQTIKTQGKTYQLKSGMLVDADILMERKSIFRWVFDPFITMLN